MMAEEKASAGSPLQGGPSIRQDAGGYSVRTHESQDSFSILRSGWEALSEKDERATIFQTWAWVSHMWELERVRPVSMKLLTIRNGAGDLVAIAPMLVERRFGPLNFRILRFIGQGLSDYQDVLLDPDGNETCIAGTIAEWLRSLSGEYDIVDLSDLRENSRILRHRNVLFPERLESIGRLEKTDVCLYIPVNRTWEEYLRGFNSKERNSIKRLKQRMQEQDVTLVVEDGSANPRASVADFLRLHRLRMESKGERGMFRGPRHEQVLSDLFCDLLKAKRMKILFLAHGDSPKAATAVLEHRGKSYWYNVGLDPTPAIMKMGLGKMVALLSIENAFRSGKKEFDLCRGSSQYKKEFASESRQNSRFVQSLSRGKGRVYLAYLRFLREAYSKDWLRKIYLPIWKRRNLYRDASNR